MSSLHHEVKSMSWLLPCKIKPVPEVSVVIESTLTHDPIYGDRQRLGEPWECRCWCYCLSTGSHSLVLCLLWPLCHLSYLFQIKLLLYIFIITHMTGKQIAIAICEPLVYWLQVWAHSSWKAALNVVHHQNMIYLFWSNGLHSTFLCTQLFWFVKHLL